MNIQIGSKNWKNELIASTKVLGEEFWSGFLPVSKVDIERFETNINRKLPSEFTEFYKTIGYGSIEPGNGFYSLDDMYDCLGASIYFIRGSLFHETEWASKEEHRKLWRSRGRDNPDPVLFTEEIFTLEDIKLYDLLQIGADGNGCYHQLYVGPEPIPFRYCLLTDSGTIVNKEKTFSAALIKIIDQLLLLQS